MSNDDTESKVVIQASNLKKWFSLRKGFLSHLLHGKEGHVRAVDGVDFKIRQGETYGLVGESGCGKSTLANLLIKVMELTDGNINFLGFDITNISSRKIKKLRKDIQMIFQDPFSSLPVRLKVKEILYEPLKFQNVSTHRQTPEMLIREALEAVNLVPIKNFIDKYPNELSGGERQRVSIARAVIIKPRFIIADEPTSMLDASIKAGILKLLTDLKEKYRLTMLFITHDLVVARYMCDRIGIMYLGKIIEEGPAKEILRNPHHPYTMLLKAVLPTLDPRRRHHLHDIPLREADAAKPTNIPSGCRFHPRCPYAKEICTKEEPSLREFKDRRVACHLMG